MFSVVLPLWNIWSFLFFFLLSVLPFYIKKINILPQPYSENKGRLNFWYCFIWFCLHIKSMFWVLIILHNLLWIAPTFSSSCMCVGMCVCSVRLRIKDSILHNACTLSRAKFLSCFEPSGIIDFKRIYYVPKWLHTAVEEGIKLVPRD